MVWLGLNPGAAVEAAALVRGVGAPGGEVGTLLLLSCLIGDKARVRVSTGLGFLGSGCKGSFTRGVWILLLLLFPCNFSRINSNPLLLIAFLTDPRLTTIR
jgi:hypothetical protein